MRKVSLLIIGAGNLGSRLARLFAENTVLVKQIYLASKSGERAKTVAAEFPDRIIAVSSTEAITESIDFVFLCCKPKDFLSGVESVKSIVGSQSKFPSLCSMLAGVSLESLTEAFDGTPDLLRAMPNIALSYKKSVTGFIGASTLTFEQRELFVALLAPGGFTLQLETEEAIDALTAMASSGLAYFARLSESLAKTARSHGFSESEALSLATQTLIGAGVMAEHLELPEIRRQVATKGGTTERALEVFENKNLDGIVSEAVEAAMLRAKELRK